MSNCVNTNCELFNTFHETFSKLIETPPKSMPKIVVKLSFTWLNSILGPMLAIADEQHLYILEFIQRIGLTSEIERLRNKLPAVIVPGRTKPLDMIEEELAAYFSGNLAAFKTPIKMIGSDFQQSVWQALCTVPYGKTKSYAEQAASIGKPTAYRAVANANGMNPLAIIVPCHRIIRSHGDLGGYGGGIEKKQWLLQHEAKYFNP